MHGMHRLFKMLMERVLRLFRVLRMLKLLNVSMPKQRGRMGCAVLPEMPRRLPQCGVLRMLSQLSEWYD
jgi:hypothetical protein